MLEKSIGFLILPVVTRYLAVSEYGHYSLYISVATFLSIFIGFGGDNFARLLTAKSPEVYSEIKYILFIYFFLSLIIILGILIYTLEFTNFIPLNDNEIMLAVLDSSLIFAINYKLCVLQAQRKVVKYCIVNLTRVALYVIIILFGFLFFDFKVNELIVTRLISCFIVVILFCLPAKNILKGVRISFTNIRRTSKFIFSLLPNSIILGFTNIGDRLIMANISLTLLGSFNFLLAVIMPYILIVQILHKATFPLIINHYKKDQIDQINIINISMLLIFSAFIFLTLPIYIYLLETIAGIDYIDNLNLVYLFALVPLIQNFYFSFARVLTFTEKVHYLSFINIPISVLYILIILLFVNTLEVFILSYVLLELIKTILVVTISNKIIKHNFLKKKYLSSIFIKFKNFKKINFKFV